MKRILVWDLPVRLFHWILAGSFVVAFAIANLSDDESPAFALHMLLGGVMAFMVVLRLLWGIAGSRWARFNSFEVSPTKLAAYIKGALTGGGKRYTGHNPGSSIAALLMFGLVLGLAATGVVMGSGGEAIEQFHQVLAWSMVALIGAHVAGIVLHTLRHRENIAWSMIDGRKEAEPAGAIPSARPVMALAFLVVTALWTAGLVDGYDAASGQVTLPVIGQTLQVREGADGGDAEHEDQEHRGDREHEGHDDGD